MSELLSKEAMDTAIEQWVFARKKIAEENSIEIITNMLMSDVMQQLRASLDQNKTPQGIAFAFKQNGEIIGSVIGETGENIAVRVADKRKREQIYERIKKAFTDNPNLEVKEKKDEYDGIYYKEICVSVKED